MPNKPGITLYEEARKRHMCLITWFRSLAFTDGVFQDMESLNDLETVESIPGSPLYRAKCRPKILECPVMGGMRAVKFMSETRIWKYDCFNSALKGAMKKSGYQ